MFARVTVLSLRKLSSSLWIRARVLITWTFLKAYSNSDVRETQRPFGERPLKALKTKEADRNEILSRTGGHSSSRNQGNLVT